MKKNDREMTEGLYGGVQGFWVRTYISLTTENDANCNVARALT